MSGSNSGGSGFQTTSFDTPLQDIPEEGTPLRFSFPRDQCQRPLQSTGSSGGSRSSNGGRKAGSKKSSPATAAKQADQGDLESPQPGGAKSWLSQRLRWPVVPIYSDVGTGRVHHLTSGPLYRMEVGVSCPERSAYTAPNLAAIIWTGHWWEASLHFIAMTAAPAGAMYTLVMSEPDGMQPFLYVLPLAPPATTSASARAAAYVTGPYALSRLTWAGIPILALVLASHYYCGMLMVRNVLRFAPEQTVHVDVDVCV